MGCAFSVVQSIHLHLHRRHDRAIARCSLPARGREDYVVAQIEWPISEIDRLQTALQTENEGVIKALACAVAVKAGMSERAFPNHSPQP